MGIFTKEKSLKFKAIPSAPEQTEARGYLQGTYQQELKFPTQQIADLTPEEQMIQGALPDYFAQSGGDYNLARNYYADILSGKYDPLTSPYYQGMRTNLEARKKAGVQGVLRSQQSQGVLKSGPTAALAAEQERMYNADIGTLEGGLLNEERNRMGQAAAGLPALSESRLSTMAGVSQLAEKKRLIEQDRNQAAFETAISDMLAPYLYNAKIAMALLNEQRYAGYETGGGLTDLGFMTAAASGFAGQYYQGAGAGGSAGGAAAA